MIAQRVIVIGLDSATFDLLGPWMDQGRLPHLARLKDEGASGELTTVMPALSPAAWASFMTGKNPGKHGVIDWFQHAGRSYQRCLVSSDSVHGPKLWDILGRKGRTVGVVNVPITYPPRPVNGFLLSGLLTPRGSTDFAYPPKLADELLARFGPISHSKEDEVYSPEQEASFLHGQQTSLERRIEMMFYLLERHPQDLHVFVFMETDSVQHKYWKYLDDPASSYHEAILGIYRRLDEAIGQVVQMLGPDTLLIVMSDHGAGPLVKMLHLNQWLMQYGYLHFKGNLATQAKRWAAALNLVKFGRRALARVGLEKVGLLVPKTTRRLVMDSFLTMADIDWSRTRAYALGNTPGQIFINLKGREPQGIVSPGEEYQALREELANRLLELRDPEDGERVMDGVFRREEVYAGPCVERVPDLLFTMRGMSYIASEQLGFGRKPLFGPNVYGNSGCHRLQGILLMAGGEVRRGATIKGAQIVDVAPTILWAMGLPVSRDMDGRVLTAAFAGHVVAARPIEYEEVSGGDEERGQAETGYSAEEDEEIKGRLRGLGYIE